VSITTDMRARELRASAEAYFKQYDLYIASGVPAEYLTEIAWSSEMADRMYYNRLLDDLP